MYFQTNSGGLTLVRSTIPSKSPVSGVTPASSIHIERDFAVVFSRAFWRPPIRGDRIIAAERRTWFDDKSKVRKWQWFIAVNPSLELRHWLFEENPFELARRGGETQRVTFESAPDWFPTPLQLNAFTQFRALGSSLSLFLDQKTGTLFATDQGGGFSDVMR